jgi:phage terminase large subunit-like protein
MAMGRRLRPPHHAAISPAAAKVFGRIALALESDWSVKARSAQLPPPGDWRIWLLLAGRGFGKTRSGAEWVRGLVESGSSRIALVAATAADVRDVMIEGESGILAISPTWNRPVYEPSKRRVTWPNGAIATAYSADEPERLRGPQHDAAWADELAAWRYADAWDQLMFGLRLGKNPRCVVTTTPKPTKLVRELVKRDGKDVVVTRGRTEENRANLAPAFLNQIVSKYAGTRLGRQELDAELLEDVPGALWTHDMIERARISDAPSLTRIAVAIDPAGKSGEDADETGIIVAGTDGKGRGYILEDLSGRYQPTTWARRAIGTYKRHHADRIVAEVNYGGEMVEATLRAVDPSVAFKAVTASRGKVVRAEPISALYEQGRVHHVGLLPELEDQMCGFANDFDRVKAGYSPDRVDALCFALSELLVGETCDGWLEYWAREAAIARGEVQRPKIDAIPGPKTADGTPPRPRVTLRAPGPHMNYAPSKGKRYSSNADGVIENVDADDLAPLLGAGCLLF